VQPIDNALGNTAGVVTIFDEGPSAHPGFGPMGKRITGASTALVVLCEKYKSGGLRQRPAGDFRVSFRQNSPAASQTRMQRHDDARCMRPECWVIAGWPAGALFWK
jgi:hypothetical protein